MISRCETAAASCRRENRDRAEPRTVSACERFDLLRQLIFERHPSAIDQNGYNGNFSSQSGRNFNADKIIRVVQQGRTARPASEPTFADDSKQDVAFLDLAVEMHDKIYAERNVVDVFEDVFLAEIFLEPIVDAAHDSGAVTPPIT